MLLCSAQVPIALLNDLHTDEWLPEKGSEESPPDRDITAFGITRRPLRASPTLCCSVLHHLICMEIEIHPAFPPPKALIIFRLPFIILRESTDQSSDESGIGQAPRALGSYLSNRNITPHLRRLTWLRENKSLDVDVLNAERKMLLTPTVAEFPSTFWALRKRYKEFLKKYSK